MSLSSYTGYVPKRVLDHFKEHPQPLDSAWSECIDGVILHIRLDRIQKKQIHLVNQLVIEPIITICESYGGDIIHLSCSDVIVLWPWEDHASHAFEIRIAAICAQQIAERFLTALPSRTRRSSSVDVNDVHSALSAMQHISMSSSPLSNSSNDPNITNHQNNNNNNTTHANSHHPPSYSSSSSSSTPFSTSFLQGEETLGRKCICRLGIAASEHIFFSTIGGFHDRWRFLLSGDAVTESTKAIGHALNSGDIVIAPNTWLLIQQYAEGSPLMDGFVKLSSVVKCSKPRNISPSVAPAENNGLAVLLSTHIPTPIQIGLPEPQRQLWNQMDRSEIRYATLLCINLPNLKVNWETESLLQKAFALFQSELIHYQGYEITNFSDENGVSLIAIFGSPVLLYEDHFLRGLSAALSFQRQWPRIVQSLFSSQNTNQRMSHFRIGITRGDVFCGVIGTKMRRNYTFYGAAIDRCYSLALKADETSGQILFDEGNDRDDNRTNSSPLIRYHYDIMPVSLGDRQSIVTPFTLAFKFNP